MSVSNLFIEVAVQKMTRFFTWLRRPEFRYPINEINTKEGIIMSKFSKFLDILSDVIEAAAEEKGRTVAMEMVNRNTMFLDKYARELVKDLSNFNTTSYYARRQIEVMNLTNDEKSYLKRRIIMEASSVGYYAKSQIDAVLRTI